jgi:hypothetical protein
MNQNMNQTNDKNIVSEMIETQREYINTLLQEKYYLSEENKLLQERSRQNELLIDTMQVKYISYLDDYAKNSIVLTEKIKLLEVEMANLKKELEKEKEKNIPIGMRINDLDDDWDWEEDNGKLHIDDLNTSEEVTNKEKYVIEYLYTTQPSHNSKKNDTYISSETQTEEYEYSESTINDNITINDNSTINDNITINDNNKTIFPDLSSILQYSCNGLDEYIDKYDSYLFERF